MKNTLLAATFSALVFGNNQCGNSGGTSQMDMIAGKQWVYTEVYTNTTAHKTGTKVFERGAANNIQDHSKTRVFFWENGVHDEVESPFSSHTRMTWKFKNPEKTEYTMSWGSGSTDVKIIVLDNKTFEWYNPEQKMSGVMVAVK